MLTHSFISRATRHHKESCKLVNQYAYTVLNTLLALQNAKCYNHTAQSSISWINFHEEVN